MVNQTCNQKGGKVCEFLKPVVTKLRKSFKWFFKNPENILKIIPSSSKLDYLVCMSNSQIMELCGVCTSLKYSKRRQKYPKVVFWNHAESSHCNRSFAIL